MDLTLELLEKLEVTGSTNTKLELMKMDTTGGLKTVFHMTYDYQRLYFIKKLDEVEGKGEFDPDWLNSLAQQLDLLKVAGRTQAGKANFADWLSRQSPLVAKWARRIVLRDLRCNATTELANKAGFDVPVFEVQLAKDGEKCKKLGAIIKDGLYLTPKFDGYRCLAVLRDGECTLYSRNGTVFENFPAIQKAIEEQFAHLKNIVFDGEIMSDDFNSMQQSAFASKRGTVVGDVKYFIFDVLNIEEWNTQKFLAPYRVRRAQLDMWLKANFRDPLRVVRGQWLPQGATLEDIKAIEREYAEMGFEGAMGNPGNLPYYTGRVSNGVLKFKSMLSMDCEVIDWFPGKLGTKYESSLGGLVVMQENGVKCEVGSGYSDIERDEIFMKIDEIIGRKMEVKYQELTPDGVMRFPVKLRWRNDK